MTMEVTVNGFTPIALAVATLSALTIATGGSVTGASTDECDDPPQLSTLTGTLERTDKRFFIGAEEIDPGPKWYLKETTAEYDYDGDGEIETMWAEINGLVGTEVTVRVDDAGRGDDRDMYRINGLPWRAADGCPPPWAGGPGGGGPPPGSGPPPWTGSPPVRR